MSCKPARSACSTEGAQAEAERALQRIERVGQGKQPAVAISEPATALGPLTDDNSRLGITGSVGPAEAPGTPHAVPPWLPLPPWQPACNGQLPNRPPPSSQAALSSSPALGRFAVAAAPLQAGWEVMSEGPYAAAIHKAFLHQVGWSGHNIAALPALPASALPCTQRICRPKRALGFPACSGSALLQCSGSSGCSM